MWLSLLPRGWRGPASRTEEKQAAEEEEATAMRRLGVSKLDTRSPMHLLLESLSKFTGQVRAGE